MRRIIGAVALLALLRGGAVVAQISPGELSKAHAALEGMGNCTSCHAIGKDVSAEKCLSCHKELNARIAAGTSYHATLKSRACVECHKEHFGRDFKLVRLDVAAFKHAETGFKLDGKHQAQRCENCHIAKFIVATDVKSNKQLMASGTTALGLSRACASCHTDIHKGQFKAECTACHTTSGWKPAVLFAHEKTKFPLLGKHANVKCVDCHKVESDGKTRKFAGLVFETCNSCHTDPHKGKFKEACADCHSVNNWHTVSAGKFDHARTRFPLVGKHRTTPCASCHRGGATADGGTRRTVILKFDKCMDCHKDKHGGEFASRKSKGDCAECHTEEGYTPAKFVHATTHFALEGKHQNVACVKCHPAPSSPQAALNFAVQQFTQCRDCHKDAHGGQFARRVDRGECASCHNTAGFLPANFSVKAHAESRLPLEGAHMAVSCAQCHPGQTVKAASTRQFAWEGPIVCETCHKDPHDRQFVGKKWSTCVSCHVTDAWTKIRFAHELTSYVLDGQHLNVACDSCHLPKSSTGGAKKLTFTKTPTTCADCHGTNIRRGNG